MDEYLMREDAPLSPEEWAYLDEAVVQAAKKILVGRRFLPLFGPLGMGTQTVPVNTVDWSAACIHYEGADVCGHEECAPHCDCSPVSLAERRYLSMPILHKDFCLSWRDIAAARQLNTPLDLSPAAAAAAAVAMAEDEFIFKGNDRHGFAGLLNAQGRQVVPLEDWGEPGTAFANVAAARGALVQDGFFGPYALVLSPGRLAQVQRIMPEMGRLEIHFLADLATAGVFQSPLLSDEGALFLSAGPENLDLAIAQDLITAYLGPEGMNHSFRVLESLVLRVKRPAAICTLEG